MLDFLFPNLCIYCEKSVNHTGLCDDCYSGIKFLDNTAGCGVCGATFVARDAGEYGEHLCARCLRSEFYFARARSVAYFDGLLRDLLHGFKYRRMIHVGKFLSDVFVKNIPTGLDFYNLILPVPIHLKKLKEREYNQSAILCKRLSEVTECEYDPFALCKTGDTPPQISFEKLNDRKRNVKNFFSVRGVKKIKNTSILLVDDVYTTGSTVNECSRVLLGAGAASVQVLTLMRADK